MRIKTRNFGIQAVIGALLAFFITGAANRPVQAGSGMNVNAGGGGEMGGLRVSAVAAARWAGAIANYFNSATPDIRALKDTLPSLKQINLNSHATRQDLASVTQQVYAAARQLGLTDSSMDSEAKAAVEAADSKADPLAKAEKSAMLNTIFRDFFITKEERLWIEKTAQSHQEQLSSGNRAKLIKKIEKIAEAWKQPSGGVSLDSEAAEVVDASQPVPFLDQSQMPEAGKLKPASKKDNAALPLQHPPILYPGMPPPILLSEKPSPWLASVLETLLQSPPKQDVALPGSPTPKDLEILTYLDFGVLISKTRFGEWKIRKGSGLHINKLAEKALVSIHTHPVKSYPLPTMGPLKEDIYFPQADKEYLATPEGLMEYRQRDNPMIAWNQLQQQKNTSYFSEMHSQDWENHVREAQAGEAAWRASAFHALGMDKNTPNLAEHVGLLLGIFNPTSVVASKKYLREIFSIKIEGAAEAIRSVKKSDKRALEVIYNAAFKLKASLAIFPRLLEDQLEDQRNLIQSSMKKAEELLAAKTDKLMDFEELIEREVKTWKDNQYKDPSIIPADPKARLKWLLNEIEKRNNVGEALAKNENRWPGYNAKRFKLGDEQEFVYYYSQKSRKHSSNRGFIEIMDNNGIVDDGQRVKVFYRFSTVESGKFVSVKRVEPDGSAVTELEKDISPREKTAIYSRFELAVSYLADTHALAKEAAGD